MALEIVKRSDRAQGFEVLPKRWIVKRTIGWLGNCRRVGKTICYSLSGRETYVMLEALYRLFSAEDRPGPELATGVGASDGA